MIYKKIMCKIYHDFQTCDFTQQCYLTHIHTLDFFFCHIPSNASYPFPEFETFAPQTHTYSHTIFLHQHLKRQISNIHTSRTQSISYDDCMSHGCFYNYDIYSNYNYIVTCCTPHTTFFLK